MIKKEIIDLIASRTKIKQRELIEKDLVLHRILLELSYIKEFAENYAFKGGTCLAKCYFGYYRFSEDLDFTYIKQEKFKDKSEKEKRRLLSNKIKDILVKFKEIADKLELDFKPDKRDARYIEFGRSNKQITLKIYYKSQETNIEALIKIEINFEEVLFYSIKRKPANNIFFGRLEDFEFAFLLPENSEWVLRIPNMKCYDIREILIEKIRAILTRRMFKPRDFIDVFFILGNNKIKVEDYRKQILKKTFFMLKYEKYIQNLKNFNSERFVFGDEEKLLLRTIDKDEFNKFIKSIILFLDKLSDELNKKFG